MREYILTKKEREIIETYKKRKAKLEGFSQLKTRTKQLLPTLKKDIEMLESLIE